jgi:small subunit ribosomal protein S5
MRDHRDQREQKNYDKRMVALRRVSKVHAGGKRLRFSAFVVAGDRRGRVGVALGRGMDTRSAIAKAEKKASSNMKAIELVGDTIPHELRYKKGAAEILLRPARPGSGVIAGSAARVVLEMAGIENVYCKQLGSNDMIANAYCTFEALTKMRKGRVLNKMKKMRERIGLKEKIDEERRKREAKLAKTRKSGKKDNNRSRNRRHVPRKNS